MGKPSLYQKALLVVGALTASLAASLAAYETAAFFTHWEGANFSSNSAAQAFAVDLAGNSRHGQFTLDRSFVQVLGRNYSNNFTVAVECDREFAACPTVQVSQAGQLVPCIAFGGSNQSVTVGVLAGHDGFTAWNDTCTCTGATGEQKVRCNLRIYEAAVALAARQGVRFLIFSEGYALGVTGFRSDDYYEQFDDIANGTTPCNTKHAGLVQKQLSCVAAMHRVGLAANIMTQNSRGTRHITELVFDTQGLIVSFYHKHTLFDWLGMENYWSNTTPGPFSPTTFPLFGRRWGIIICYEGFAPFLSGDFSQFESLIDQGASTFVWSIGPSPDLLSSSSLLPAAKMIAERYGVNIVATQGIRGAILDRFGQSLAEEENIAIDASAVEGYAKHPVIIKATLGSASYNGNACCQEFACQVQGSEEHPLQGTYEYKVNGGSGSLRVYAQGRAADIVQSKVAGRIIAALGALKLAIIFCCGCCWTFICTGSARAQLPS